MDIPRKSAARKRLIRRIVYSVIAVVALGGITIAVSRLKPAAPTVDGNTVWRGTVKRGSMLRQVRGLGTLVPEEIRIIPATVQGRVEKRNLQPGETVSAGTIIFVLSNFEIEQAALDAQSQLRQAEADYNSLKAQLDRRLLDQKSQAATVQADYSEAKLTAEVNESLYKQQLISEVQFKVSKVRAEELATRHQIEKERLEKTHEEIKAQLAAQEQQVQQARAAYQLRRQQVEELNVRAGIDGVLQSLAVEVGQQVTPGTELARVANPSRLKAELRIAETQTKDITVGLPATIDTRNGIIPGRVMRIDPAAQNGTVTVDVSLEGELPRGARPALSVDGTIELERLENVLYVDRPVSGQENSKIGIFKLEPGTNEAVRTQVTLGRASVNHIEVIDGLREGDVVILSDMSAYDNTDRVRLN
ncbi:MAG TPA: HlyD family efflux transporter periplasmic adaptor subunit [Blastocatellia bacterium]|nr:HlyD family efflux transporter periplasmic adaptor subunit [Blastocatellia bacterium]